MESSPNLLPVQADYSNDGYELNVVPTELLGNTFQEASSPVMFEITDEMADYLLVDEESLKKVKTEDQMTLQPSLPTSSRIILGKAVAKLVGMKYHTGAVLVANEPLYLSRDRDNQFDMNAIAVKNGAQVMMGYISHKVAPGIASMLDQGIEVECVCEKVGTTASINLSLTFYGSFSMIPNFDDLLKESNLRNEMEDKDVLDSANQGDSRKLFDEAMGHVNLSALPLCPSPPSRLIKVGLMNHQLQALEWMHNREILSFPSNPFDLSPIDFWSRSTKNGFTQTLTGEKSENVHLCRGGVLADDMGLGKTLTVLALILMDSPPRKPISKSTQSTFENYATLIISPLSVIENWEDQIKEHIIDDNFSVIVYQGQSHGLLSRHRVILTTYDKVVSEFNPEYQTTLFKLKFKRIVLDEGHTIKAYNKSRAQACSHLKAEFRWIISGTPITNKLDDLYSILKFLQFEPYNDRKKWLSLKKHHDSGKLLQKVVQTLALRRTKAAKVNGVPIIDLKSCTIVLKRLELANVHRKKYEEIEIACGGVVKMIIGGVQSKVANEKGNLPFILSLMLRLRQYCDSPSLIPVDFLDQINNIRMGKTEWGQEMIDRLQLLLETADANNDECAICLETLQANTMVATECGHIFCRACVQAIVTKTCPLCRGKISAAKLMALQVKHEEGVGEEKFESPKIECIVRILKSTAPATKTVIFSQFTSMLRLIRERLGSEGIETDIYDGTMEKDKRSTCLTHFKKSPTANVLLMSLKCGGVGLNIVEASQVILVDPWWNTSIEQQAIDRCHRIGQLKPVTVYKLIIDSSIEGRVLEIQQKKESMIHDMFSSIKDANLSKAVKKEDRDRGLSYLFNI